MSNDASVMQPDPAALEKLIRRIRRPASLNLVPDREDEFLRKAGLRVRKRSVPPGCAGDPDIEFGYVGERPSVDVLSWVRRDSILATFEYPKGYNLYVISPPSCDLKCYHGSPSTHGGRAILVTHEPGMWWAKFREEIPRIEKGLAEFQRLADEAARELNDANARRADAERRQELAEARALYAEPAKTGCAVIVLSLAALAGGVLPLLR